MYVLTAEGNESGQFAQTTSDNTVAIAQGLADLILTSVIEGHVEFDGDLTFYRPDGGKVHMSIARQAEPVGIVDMTDLADLPSTERTED